MADTSELDYQQAIETVDRLVQRLDLSPRERAGLEADVASLKGLRQKLVDTVIHVAVFGLVGRGKSSLLNALVGQTVFQTGPLHGVTQQVASVPWQTQAGVQQVTLTGAGQSRVELVDTPGIDEVDGEQRQDLAQRVAQQADLILFVVAGDLTQLEYEALQQLHQAQKPILLVLNKADQFLGSDRQQILDKLRQQVQSLHIPPEQVLTAAAAPLLAKMVDVNGKRQVQRQRGQAQVNDLKLTMLTILQREGKALVALNSLLYADHLNQQLVERKLQIRQQSATDAIWKAALTKAIAIAVNPVLVADALGGAAVDLALIVTLSRLYGLDMSQQAALKLLRTIALATGSLSLTDLLITFGLGSLKSLLGASALATGGLTLSPYFAVAVTQAAVAGVATYVIGTVTQQYLANDASWGSGGPKAAIADLLTTIDEESVMARIKTELSEQLSASRFKLEK
ncbi:MAG: GTP-binding protein [Cyanobacteria bacterium P01_A01_bin.105]